MKEVGNGTVLSLRVVMEGRSQLAQAQQLRDEVSSLSPAGLVWTKLFRSVSLHLTGSLKTLRSVGLSWVTCQRNSPCSVL